jgi:hypothetical protein
VTIRIPSSAPPGPPGESPEEPRYPWQLFVGMLAAILVGGAVLGLLMGVNPLTFQKLAPERQTTPIVTAAPISAAPASTTVPVVRATVAPAPEPAATPVPAQAAPVITTTAAPAGAVQAPTAAATGPTSTGGTLAQSTSAPAVPTTAPDAQAEPTPVQAQVSPDLASAILQAYNAYWSVRLRASGDPNDSSLELERVMDGEELETAKQALTKYRAAGSAFQTTVRHQIWITYATPTEATVVDRYTGNSTRLDLSTKQPDGSEPVVESYTEAFLLKSVDGVWKVVGTQPEG